MGGEGLMEENWDWDWECVAERNGREAIERRREKDRV